MSVCATKHDLRRPISRAPLTEASGALFVFKEHPALVKRAVRLISLAPLTVAWEPYYAC